jgi:hypothetical protein
VWDELMASDEISRDRTGEFFKSGVKLNKSPELDQRYMKNPAELTCAKCEDPAGRFKVIADNAESPLVFFVCTHCLYKTRVFELKVPQLNDYIAKETGLFLPDPSFNYEVDFD